MENIMAYKIVQQYLLQYEHGEKKYSIFFLPEGEETYRQMEVEPLEFIALSDMFRNEGPINYDERRNTFQTDSEPVGQEETRWQSWFRR